MQVLRQLPPACWVKRSRRQMAVRLAGGKRQLNRKARLLLLTGKLMHAGQPASPAPKTSHSPVLSIGKFQTILSHESQVASHPRLSRTTATQHSYLHSPPPPPPPPPPPTPPPLPPPPSPSPPHPCPVPPLCVRVSYSPCIALSLPHVPV